MNTPLFFFNPDRFSSSYLVLLSFLVLGILAGLLCSTGLLGWMLRYVGLVVRAGVWSGFRLWKRLLSWAHWAVFLFLVLAFLTLGALGGQRFPVLAMLCGTGLLFLGVTTCLAYLFIDLERYEVARGYKALYNPLKGQELAANLVQYGRQVGVPLLIVATAATVGGFALTNQGVYETVGRDWYTLGASQATPAFADFLAYTLINLFRVVDVLNVAESYNFVHVSYVHQARWPVSTALAAFKIFFTLVLLEQIFSSVRRKKLLAETVSDFWSPHAPIHERASGALPQHGPGAARPLLLSLRSVPEMTAQQRIYVPQIIAAIGPATIPVLVKHVNDPYPNVRAVAALALGLLHARGAVTAMIRLGHDPSDWVRQSLVEALGIMGNAGAKPVPRKRSVGGAFRASGRWLGERFGRPRVSRRARQVDPTVLVVATLRSALADSSMAVRTQAARSLGLVGTAAIAAAPDLIALLPEGDEGVRCQAAEALATLGGSPADTVAALVRLLEDPVPVIRTSAAKALGALKGKAALAIPALLPLLQERDEAVRQAVAEAVGQIGTLQEEAIPTITEGLLNRDNVVRAETAEVLGTIGAPAAEATCALAEALEDPNDRVRAKAAQALGRMGESAAEAVPQLVRALRDKDNWVSALAAEALGEMGDFATTGIPALVRSLRHINPQVRANAAQALGKMGDEARSAIPSLQQAARDEDVKVRSHALFALGEIGQLTEAAGRVLLGAVEDPTPQVRAAAVEALGKREELKEAGVNALLRALDDANYQVRIQVAKALPKLAMATPAVIDGLCKLLQDANVAVQIHAAPALGKLGPAAAAAGEALLRAAQTGEAEVREQALRAITMIQPPEALLAFRAGLKDAQAENRMVASAGLLMAGEIPPDVIPEVVEALRDPEIQVQANAARVLGRLDHLPRSAIEPLIECAVGLDDGLRLNATLALRLAPPNAVSVVFHQLLTDSNQRIRLIATGYLLDADSTDVQAAAVLVTALADPATRFREAALELVETLGRRGAAFLETLHQRTAVEVDPLVIDLLAQLIENLEPPVAEDQEPASGPPIYVGKDNDRGGDELAVVGAAPSTGNIS
jgi:HEAT repeat protein